MIRWVLEAMGRSSCFARAGWRVIALLKKIITQSPFWLAKNEQMPMHHIPQLVVEIGYEQGKQVQDIFKSAGFSSIAVHQDLFGKDRFVTGELHGCAQLSKLDRHLP